jgi:thiosulfate reductase cytochrome b subunit
MYSVLRDPPARTVFLVASLYLLLNFILEIFHLACGKRALVPTGHGYVLPDQNGWSRYLHFQAAWVVVLTGLLYVIFGLFTGHLRKNLLPGRPDLSWRAFSTAIASHLRFERPSAAEAYSYNVVPRLTYLFVILFCSR